MSLSVTICTCCNVCPCSRMQISLMSSIAGNAPDMVSVVRSLPHVGRQRTRRALDLSGSRPSIPLTQPSLNQRFPQLGLRWYKDKQERRMKRAASLGLLIPLPRTESAAVVPSATSRQIAAPQPEMQKTRHRVGWAFATFSSSGIAYVPRAGKVYRGELKNCEIVPGELRCTYTGGHLEWQCFLPAIKVHPLGREQPFQQLCSVHYVSE